MDYVKKMFIATNVGEFYFTDNELDHVDESRNDERKRKVAVESEDDDAIYFRLLPC